MTGMLYHSPADILRYRLVELGLGSLPSENSSWPISVSKELSEPDNTVTVYNTQGRLFGRAQFTGEVQEHYGIQLRVRATDVPTAWDKVRGLIDTLDTAIKRDLVVIEGITPRTYRIYSFNRSGSALELGRESPKSTRQLFTINGTISISEE